MNLRPAGSEKEGLVSDVGTISLNVSSMDQIVMSAYKKKH